MDIIVAGGCEQMTGMNMVNPDIEIDEKLMEENPDAYIIMGETAELVAEKYNRKYYSQYIRSGLGGNTCRNKRHERHVQIERI